jgi:hypothetical protein
MINNFIRMWRYTDGSILFGGYVFPLLGLLPFLSGTMLFNEASQDSHFLFTVSEPG